jgi:branched-chain amino acid transport system permease protein
MPRSQRSSHRLHNPESWSLMELLAEQILNGITLGTLYALVAVGLSLIFGVSEIVNFAHGEFFMLGSFAFFFVYTPGLFPYWLTILLTMLVMATFGLIFHFVVLQRVMTKRMQVQLMATLAASIVLANAAIMVWGTTPRQTPTEYSRMILNLAGLTVSAQRIVIVILTVAAFLGLHGMLKYTRIGKAMRAMAQNREACSAVGIDPVYVSRITLAVGAALCGLAGALISPVFQVFPTMGLLLTLKAFAVVIIGGFGNVSGAICAAFAVGLAEAMTAGYLSSAYTEAVPFVVLLAVLVAKPHGLFGHKVGL